MKHQTAIKNLFYKKMLANGVWYHIEKMEPEDNGYDIEASLQPSPRAYEAIDEIVSRLKRYYSTVNVIKRFSYHTREKNYHFSISLICRDPRLNRLLWNPLRAA